MPHLFTELRSQVEGFKEINGLLATVDRLHEAPFILNLAAKEVDEVIEELDKPELEMKKFLAELSDVMVFLFSYLIAHKPSFKPENHLAYVNGYGRHSNAFDDWKEPILDAENERSLIEAFRRLWSILVHLPVEYRVEIMEKTLQGVLANRPPKIYSGKDPISGKPFTEDEAKEAYPHFEKAFRMIRDIVLRTLEPQDWQPHFYQIADWRNSAFNLAQLKKELALIEKPRETVTKAGIRIPSSGQVERFSNLSMVREVPISGTRGIIYSSN